VSNAMERLRHALYERTDSFGMVLEAARDLLAEHDDGVWIDTRRIEALGSVDLSHDSGDERRHSQWKVTQFSDPGAVGIGATAADALAAAERKAK